MRQLLRISLEPLTEIQPPKFSSKYATNFLATLSSFQSTDPFSVVPRVIAFLCIVTNCLLSRCSSERVIVRAGRVTFVFKVGERLRVASPPTPIPSAAACSAIMADTIAAETCSRVCKASVGATATYICDQRLASITHFEAHSRCPCIWGFNNTLCDCEPYLITRDVLVFPRNCE